MEGIDDAFEESKEQLLEKIYKLVNEKHNPSLVESDDPKKPNFVPFSCPNTNIIYHLYHNGQITHQKGAWAYLQRSEFEKWGYGDIGIKFDALKFPINDSDFGYAIMTEKNATMIHNLMKKYKSQLDQ